MPKAKYGEIYRDLKAHIERGTWEYETLLPGEHALAAQYGCSRNTIRRALAQLAADGYVQPMHGRGVRAIYRPLTQAMFTVGGIETFRESGERNHMRTDTKVLEFARLEADNRIAALTGFSVGEPLFFIRRLRYLDGLPVILDHNYFRMSQMPELSIEIAGHSVYDYLENELGMVIATSKRTLSVERATKLDESLVELNGYNCMAVISGQTFDDNGIQFEYTQSRHRPDYFQFHTVATRQHRA